MDDLRCEQFFREPNQRQHRHYEALRAFFVERRPLPDIALQFGFAHGTLRNLVSHFRARCQADQPPPFSQHSRAGDRPASPRSRVRIRRRSPTAECSP